MVEDGRGPAFPVFFFDGEKEMNIGDVKINPTLEYKPFQHMISQKIGISPNQISIYLVDRRKNPKLPFSEDRRRIPITGKVNFRLICLQKDFCFLVVLKRSRKTRSRKERIVHGLEFADFMLEKEFPTPAMHTMLENLKLLQRNQHMPFHDQITQSELADLNDRLQSLRVERENYQMAMAQRNLGSPNFNSGRGFGPDQIPKVDDWYLAPSATMTKTDNGNKKKVFCEECVNGEKNGSTTSFHLCVNDAVIARVTTPLGPISRPNITNRNPA